AYRRRLLHQPNRHKIPWLYREHIPEGISGVPYDTGSVSLASSIAPGSRRNRNLSAGASAGTREWETMSALPYAYSASRFWGSTTSHASAPTTQSAAAVRNEAVHPQCSAITGVRIAVIAPPA